MELGYCLHRKLIARDYQLFPRLCVQLSSCRVNFGKKFYKWATTGAEWPYYAIVDGMMLANTNPIQFYYIRNDMPFEFWPPLPSRALVLYAASKTALALTNNVQLTAYLKQEYKDARDKAILQDDMERSVMATPFNDFDRVTFV